jgi:hypothetical protein
MCDMQDQFKLILIEICQERIVMKEQKAPDRCGHFPARTCAAVLSVPRQDIKGRVLTGKSPSPEDGPKRPS